jgi:hypothetical protein
VRNDTALRRPRPAKESDITSMETLVTRVEDEVRELLTVGHVGLFEFRWILRSIEPNVDDDTAARISMSVLERLRASGYLLGWFMWPEPEPRELEGRPPSELGDIWADPPPGDRHIGLIER